MWFIDGHVDTLARFWTARKPLTEPNPCTDLDLPRAQAAGLGAQFFALAPVCDGVYREPYARWALQVFDLFWSAAEDPQAPVVLARSAQDVLQARAEGRLAGFLALEGADFLDGELALLRMFYRLGVRLVGLTHFRRNAAADPTTEPETGSRLTRFGCALVREMERLGVLCDAAHLAAGCLAHLLDLAQQPIVVSHANCRALCDHPRNLTDAQLQRLGENGGLIGLSFVPEFVHPDRPTLERWLDHLEHAVQVIGIDGVALGSDFDGMGSRKIPGLEEVSCFPRVAQALSDRGFSDEQVAQIAHGNWLRLIQAVLG